MTSLIVKSPANVGIYFTQEQKTTLRNTIFPKELSKDDFEIYLYVCARTGLDPFMKQIHAIPKREYGSDRPKMVLITAIDGHRLIAERTGRYAPGKATEFAYDKDGRLISATAYVKKLTADGTWHEVSGVAYYDEYCQRKKDGSPTETWHRMRHVMLAKCAEVIALRKAFPAEMSGLYAKEEMDQAFAPEEIPAEVIAEVEQIKQIAQDEVEKFVAEFKDDMFKEFFEAVCKAYSKKSIPEVMEMLNKDMNETKTKFESWKSKQTKKAA